MDHGKIAHAKTAAKLAETDGRPKKTGTKTATNRDTSFRVRLVPAENAGSKPKKVAHKPAAQAKESAEFSFACALGLYAKKRFAATLQSSWCHTVGIGIRGRGTLN